MYACHVPMQCVSSAASSFRFVKRIHFIAKAKGEPCRSKGGLPAKPRFPLHFQKTHGQIACWAGLPEWRDPQPAADAIVRRYQLMQPRVSALAAFVRVSSSI